MTATAEKCSKCGGPRDTKGNPLWCKACRAAYQRDYQDTKGTQTHAAGIAAMREYLVAQFERLGAGGFTGSEVASLIRQSKGPPPE